MRLFSRLAAIAAAVLFVALYARSPIDVVPDRIGALGLLDDLLVLVLAAWWLRRRLQPETELRRRRGAGDAQTRDARGASGGEQRRTASSRAGEASGESPWDPWRVLGVTPGATPDEIARAYRARLKLYHPDRVADLGEELRQLAHDKVLALNRAYEELTRRA